MCTLSPTEALIAWYGTNKPSLEKCVIRECKLWHSTLEQSTGKGTYLVKPQFYFHLEVKTHAPVNELPKPNIAI